MKTELSQLRKHSKAISLRIAKRRLNSIIKRVKEGKVQL